MATTEKLGLIQPETTDTFSVEHFNTNMAVLDADAKADAAIHTEISENLDEIKKNTNEINTDFDTANTNLNNIAAKIGNSSDSGTTTIFGKLNNSNTSAIKSIQHKVYNYSYTAKEPEISINTVNPEKCIVIVERLHETATSLPSISYTLEASKLKVVFGTGNSSTYGTTGFWIIEFN